MGRFRPPATSTSPRMSSRLPRIDPASDAFTRSTRPARSATIATISSAALPQVALSKPPVAGPHRAASASVAPPISVASGTTARPAAMNTPNGGASSQASAPGTGEATSSQRAPRIPNSTDSPTARTRPSPAWGGRRRAAVELAALGEALHRLVVLEHGIAPRRGEAAARDFERQVAKSVGLALALVRQLDDARHGVELDCEVHRPAVLMRQQLPRTGQDE